MKLDRMTSTERSHQTSQRWKVASPSIKGKTTKSKPEKIISNLALLRKHVEWFALNLQDGFGMTPLCPSVLDQTAQKWENLMGPSTVEGFMKWFYASCFSYITVQELPPFPGRSDLTATDALVKAFGTGQLCRFLRSLLYRKRRAFTTSSSRAERRRAMVVAQTIANMKKGSPVPSETAVEASRLKHHAALTNQKTCSAVKLDSTLEVPRPGCQIPWSPMQDAPLDERKDFDAALLDRATERCLRRTTREVFRGREFRLKGVTFPSISGHFDSARGKSGAARVIKELLDFPVGNDLDAMFYHPRFGVCERRGERGQRLAEEFWKRERSFDCKPSFILEPLKVRAVTAGPSLEYFACMELQKFMWRTLKNHPTFELIGKPVTSDVLNDSLLPLCGEAGKWMSGDYSAATDNLRQFLSRAAFDEMCDVVGVPSWLRRIGSKALVGHKIHYQQGSLKGVVATQWNGQLMGSPLSFPILCLVNATLCRLPFEISDWSEDRKLKNLPIKVNGDDCIMKYTDRQKEEWERVSKNAGLSPSVGKCYFSESFLQINSENFLIEDGKFVTVPYMNFSLLNSTKSKGAEERSWADLGAAAREFIAGFPVPEQARLMSVFLRRQRTMMDRAPKFMSWWLPECLGGMGLPWFPEELRSPTAADLHGPWPEWDPPVTYRQRQFATYLRGRIESGEAPLRRYSAAKVPKWVKNGMRLASEHEVPAPINLQQDPDAVDPYRAVPRTSGFGPWMWQSLQEATDEDFEMDSLEELACIKGWYAAWKQSLKDCNWARPTSELLCYKPPEFHIPGGMGETWEKARHCTPKDLLGSLNSAYFCHLVGKINSNLVAEGHTR